MRGASTSTSTNFAAAGDDDVPLLALEEQHCPGGDDGGAAIAVAAAAEPAFIRPPEPAVKLELLLESQLQAMVKQGKEGAEASRVQSGFFGGATPIAIVVWSAFFITGAVSAGAALFECMPAPSQPPPPPGNQPPPPPS